VRADWHDRIDVAERVFTSDRRGLRPNVVPGKFRRIRRRTLETGLGHSQACLVVRHVQHGQFVRLVEINCGNPIVFELSPHPCSPMPNIRHLNYVARRWPFPRPVAAVESACYLHSPQVNAFARRSLKMLTYCHMLESPRLENGHLCERARWLGSGRRRTPLMHMTASAEKVVNIRRLFAGKCSC